MRAGQVQLQGQRVRRGWPSAARVFTAAFVAAAGPAVAAPLYLGSALSSAVSGRLIDAPAGATPVDARYVSCTGNACYEMAVHAGPDRLEAQARSHGPSAFETIATVRTTAEALAFGEMTLVADTPGLPVLVPVNVTLQLEGGFDVAVDAATSAWARMRLHLGAGTSSAELAEYAPGVDTPPDSDSFNLVRTGADTVVASLVLPVGRFNWSMLLTVDEQAFTQRGRYDVASHFSAGFIDGAPVFTLPEGYRLSSADFGIVDNRFCPTGCVAPLPEPAPPALVALGLVAAWAGRRRTSGSNRSSQAVGIAG